MEGNKIEIENNTVNSRIITLKKVPLIKQMLQI